MSNSKENRVLLDTTLGECLNELRKQKAYTQRELSEILNLSSTMVGFIENGERLPTMQTLWDYSSHFSIDIEELIKKRIVTVEKTFNKYGDKTPHHVMNEYYLIAYYTLLT